MGMGNSLGIFSWYGFVLPFAERIRLIREAGFIGTSLWWEDEMEPYSLQKEQMPALVRAEGLILENIHVPWCDSDALWSEDSSTRKAVIDQHSRWLQDCANFDIPMLVMHLCDGENPPLPNGYGLESMEKLVVQAEELGVKIAIENTRRMDLATTVLDHLPSSALGFCFDSSHHRLTNQEDYQVLRSYGDRLFATHLSDNDGLADRHWLPGHGIIPWAKLLENFPKSYEGLLTLEVSPTLQEAQGSPTEFLLEAYEKVKKLKIKPKIYV